MRTFIFLLSIVNSILVVNGQTHTTTKNGTESDTESRTNLYPHMGLVMIPESYEGAVTNNQIDARGGYIRSADGDFKLYWSAGMIQQPFEEYKNKFVWSPPEKVGDVPIAFAEAKVKMKNFILATVGRFQIIFGAEVRSPGDRDVFVRIVRSYKSGTCNVCRSLSINSQNGEPR